MTHSEFLQVMEQIEMHWHADATLTPDAMAVYGQQLQPESYEAVMAAVGALALEGKFRMPLAGQIKRKLVELQIDPPVWGEVARVLAEALRRSPDYVTWKDDPEAVEPKRVNDRQAYIATQHPLIQGFVELIGWPYLSEWSSADRTAEAQMRSKWEAHVANAVESAVLSGIGGGGLARIERARHEVESGATGLPMPPLREIEA